MISSIDISRVGNTGSPRSSDLTLIKMQFESKCWQFLVTCVSENSLCCYLSVPKLVLGNSKKLLNVLDK